jgi:hypothetical protein
MGFCKKPLHAIFIPWQHTQQGRYAERLVNLFLTGKGNCTHTCRFLYCLICIVPYNITTYVITGVCSVWLLLRPLLFC